MRGILIPLLFLFVLGFLWESQHQIDNERFKDVSPPRERRFARVMRRPSMLTKFVYGFYPYWVYSWEYTIPRWDLVSRIAYFSAVADSEGNITNTRGWPVTSLINEARAHGVSVDLVCTLFDNDGSRIHYLLTNPSARARLAHNLANLLRLGGEGINLDFEFPTAADSLLFPEFVQELRETLRAVNPDFYISVDIPPVDWRGSFKLSELNQVCDFIFVMAYNYYYGGSSITGPIAPFDDPTESYDVVWTCNRYLGELGGDGSKLVLGLPLYGYDWQCDGPNRGARTTSTGSPIFYYEAVESARVYGRLWDSNASSPWYRLDSWRQGWYEDAQALDYCYNFVLNQNLKGVGFWALGYDGGRSEFWAGIEHAFTPFSGSIDTIIVDDGDPEFHLFGSWAYATGSGGWNGDYYWTSTTYQGDSAVYSPALPYAGLWRVYIWYRSGSNRAPDAKVKIRAIDGETTLTIDQTTNGSVWNLLGSYNFPSGVMSRVVVSDAGSTTGRVVVADAIMFVSAGPLEIDQSLSIRPNRFELLVYPNPANSEFHIRIPQNVSGTARIELYNLRGQLLKTLFDGTIDDYDMRFCPENLPSGSYIVLFRSEQVISSANLIILK